MAEEKYRFGIADFALVATTFLWGLNAVVTKNAVGDTPETFRTQIFNGLRIPVASALLFLTVRLSGRPIGIQWRHMPLLASVSFFGMFLFMVAFVAGLYLTSASNVGVINATIPLLILLVSLLSKIDKPTKRTIAGIAIGFTGVLVLTVRDGGFSVNTGDILILGSSFCWAYYTVYAKKILAEYNPMLVVAWVYLLTSLFQLPLIIHQFPQQNWGAVSLANWANLAISIVGSLYIANTLYYYAVKKIGPTRTGVFTNLTPVFTILLAALLRGEHITVNHITGLAIIIGGIALARTAVSPKLAASS